MLKTRILTAIVLVVLLLLVLFQMPKGAAIGFFAALVLMGAWEWSAFIGLKDPVAQLCYVVLVAGLCTFAWDATGRTDQLVIAMSLASAWWVIAFLWLAFRPAAINRGLAALAGLLVLVPAWAGLARMYDKAQHGAESVLFVLVLVWAADVGAFFAGKTWGRRKLAPRVSPGKTWEGALGGLVAGLLAAVAGAWWFHLDLLPFVALGGAVVLVSIVGDLTESMFKRYAGVKDSGTLLPGHGGVMDRIDSVTAAVPVFVLGLIWLGRFP